MDTLTLPRKGPSVVRMVRIPQRLPPLIPAALREAVACRGPVLIPRQATPFRCRSTRFSRVPRAGCGEVSSVGPGLSVGGLRVSARPHGPQWKKKSAPADWGRPGQSKKGLSVMNQVNTTETVALSAPVLEALRRLDAVMKLRKRQTAAQKRIALARSRAREAQGGKR